MNIIIKKNLTICIGILFFIVILVAFIWLCVLVTDYIRYKTNSIPIFAYNVTMLQNEDTGHTEIYKGLGYKYINYSNTNQGEFYILGFKAP